MPISRHNDLSLEHIVHCVITSRLYSCHLWIFGFCKTCLICAGIIARPGGIIGSESKDEMAEGNQSTPKYSEDDMQRLLAAKDREAKAKMKAQEAKWRMARYALYTLQRKRIMRDCSKVCRACNAWQSTHLEDHGY
jgi:hypothetical protein